MVFKTIMKRATRSLPRRTISIMASGKVYCEASCLKRAGIKGHFTARFSEGKIILDKIDVTKFKEIEFLD